MTIPNQYLEDEVRDGFPVPASIKRVWAVQVKILEIVDAICKKHNIPYYAESGTLLGVVRHGGFIPWDDDLDIVMKRPDYLRFLSIAKDELPEGYGILNYFLEEEYDNYLTRIVNNTSIDRSEKFLSENFGCPYAIGIDLFVMDYLAPTEELLEEQKSLIRKLVSYVSEVKAGNKATIAMLPDYISSIEKKYNFQIDKSKSLFNQLFLLQDKILSLYSSGEYEVSQLGLSPLWVDHQGSVYDKEYFGDPIWMDFETTKIPVPVYYDAILSKKYGGYMKLIRQGSMHGYPFFEDQVKTLEGVWGASIYDYQFSEEIKQILFAPKKSKASEYHDYTDMMCQAYEGFISSFESEQYELALNILEKCQEVAISLGNSIEAKYGEGTKYVTIIEDYCESVYNLHCAIVEGNAEGINEYFSSMGNLTNAIEESIDKDLPTKRIVAILPYKACYWDQLADIWKEESGKENAEVYVIPLPYYERNMVGGIENTREALCEMDGYPVEVKLTNYSSVSLERLHPDVIIFQNPYDNYNSVTTVNPYYYSDRLKNYCDELIYIPYVKVQDFGKEDERAYKNIKDLVLKPGLMYADKILLDSENMRSIYINILSEFAGEDTRELWEQRIEYKQKVNANLEDRKKTLLYYVSASKLLLVKEKGLEKIRRTLDTFKENRDNIQIKWYHTALDDEILRINNPEIYKKYLEIVEEYKHLEIGDYDESEEVNTTTDISTAFYGDPGQVVTSMIVKGKPVMLQNVEI